MTDARPPVLSTAFAATALAALGVVYGDIGTSPLYALQESFSGPHGVPPTPENVLGVLSLFIWSLILVVCVKYLAFVLRADNHGEGGILALMALTGGRASDGRSLPSWPVVLGLFGAALLYGDGVITPSISVLSAVEGLKVATPVFENWVVPITVVVLTALFLVQPYGSGKVGRAFGPVLLLWFAVLSAIGLHGIASNPSVLRALSPLHAVRFFAEHGLHGVPVLGAVILCVTGGEALYADMGHFGARAIRVMWYAAVFPALVLCYLGQGATLLSDPKLVSQVFFNAAPVWARLPLVGIATAATVIASQALITAVFSMTQQAMQLGFFPRLRVVHTSSMEIGQVYLPAMNWALMVGCVWLVLEFRSSSRLAAAYGLAVAGTMLITTLLFAVVARRWRWHHAAVLGLCGAFFVIDAAFLGANLLKIKDGGWLPLVLGIAMFTVLRTWQQGRALARRAAGKGARSLESLLADVRRQNVHRVKGTAVFLTRDGDGAPLALVNHLRHNQALHRRVVLLTLSTLPVPRVPEKDRVAVTSHPEGFLRVLGSYGFMEEPDVTDVLSRALPPDAPLELSETTFYLGRERILATDKPGMAIWREKLYAFLQKTENPASNAFGLPPARVVEVGVQLEI